MINKKQTEINQLEGFLRPYINSLNESKESLALQKDKTQDTCELQKINSEINTIEKDINNINSLGSVDNCTASY